MAKTSSVPPAIREDGRMVRSDASNEDSGLVRVGILGCGNVGSALVGMLDTNADLITRRSGVRLEVARVAVQNLTKERDVEFAPGVLTNDASSVVSAHDVDVIVEVI